MSRLIEHHGRPHLECPECRTTIVWAAAMGPTEKANIANRRRADSGAAVQELEAAFGLGPREAKAAVLHIPPRRGWCHKCQSQISDGEGYCGKCGAANLNW